MNRPNLNEKLLRETLQNIEDNPDEWYQATWRCGTKMCFAGHACDLNGAQWEGEDDTIIAKRRFPWIGKRSKSTVNVRDAAVEALGLTRREADELFNGMNTMEDLRLMVDWIIDRRRSGSVESAFEYAERVGSERAEALKRRGWVEFPWNSFWGDIAGSIRSANGQAISILPMPVPRSPSIFLDFRGQLASHASEVPFFEIRPAEPQPALDETDQAFYEAIYDTTPDEERTEESEEVETQEELPVAVERP